MVSEGTHYVHIRVHILVHKVTPGSGSTFVGRHESDLYAAVVLAKGAIDLFLLRLDFGSQSVIV